jgi:hypothetical protein
MISLRQEAIGFLRKHVNSQVFSESVCRTFKNTSPMENTEFFFAMAHFQKVSDISVSCFILRYTTIMITIYGY